MIYMTAIKHVTLVGFLFFSALSFAAHVEFVKSPNKKPRRLRDFQCDNTFYMSSHPYGQTPTVFSTLNPYTSTAHNISTTENYGYDAIGFNHLDGFIYGISNYPHTATPHLIRIQPDNGDITDLGTLPELAGKEWIVGTIIKDGTYVIGDFATSSWLRIDVNEPRVIDGGPIPLSLITAWATNPIDNVIYGYQSYTQQLMSFNPMTREFHGFAQTLNNVGVVPCSTAFHQDGKMFLYCKTGDSSVDKMFTVNLLEETATEISSGDALGAGDLASCAFKSEPEPTPTPEPTPSPTPIPTPTPGPTPKPPKEYPGSWQNGKECIEISKDGKIASSYRKCAPLIKCQKETGLISYDADGNALIVYKDGRTQELKLLTPRRLEVSEDKKFHMDQDIYDKVRKCRWKHPLPPHPQPTPEPTPEPQPTPEPARGL